MRFEIKELQRQFGFTIIFVTHDQSEAMAISDRMMVCDMGKIMQIDTPENLYRHPNSRFVHNFLGESTFINVTVREGKVFPKGDSSFEHRINIAIPDNAGPEMVIATRPNAITLMKCEDDNGTGFRTHIEKRIFLTDKTEYLVPIGEQLVKIQTPHRVVFAPGESCAIGINSPAWYPPEDKEAEAERAKRQRF